MVALDKHKLHHWWRQVKRIKLWLLVVLLVIFAAASTYFLRQNNLGMVARRKAVVAADKNNGDVDRALKDLRSYMMAHMNTQMSQPVQLKESYNREVQRRVDAAANSGNTTDASAYKRAQDECKALNTVTYAQCVIDKTSSVAPGSNPVTNVTNPPVELFSYQFYSPTWSPDFAGFAVLGLILTLLALALRITGERTAYFLLRRHQ